MITMYLKEFFYYFDLIIACNYKLVEFELFYTLTKITSCFAIQSVIYFMIGYRKFVCCWCLQ